MTDTTNGGGTPDNPIDAARRGVRPTLRRRFYVDASVAKDPDGYTGRLDGKLVHPPARRILGAPTRSLAETIAAEWQAQEEAINPATMPDRKSVVEGKRVDLGGRR